MGRRDAERGRSGNRPCSFTAFNGGEMEQIEVTEPVKPRFILITGDPTYPNDGETCWWWDTTRKLPGGSRFFAVQAYCGRDPNQFIRVEKLKLLFTDQAEYYAVCPDCYFTFSDMQWSGSTRGGVNWRQRAEAWLQRRQAQKPWCDFCDPIFGSGGWRR